MRGDRRADEEIERLRALIPPPEAQPSDAFDELRDGALLARIASERERVPARQVKAAATTPNRRAGLRLVVAGAVAAVVAVVAVQIDSGGQPAAATTPAMLTYADGQPLDVLTGTLPVARPVLEELSRTAANGRDMPGDGTQLVETYNWYLNESGGNEASSRVIVPTHQRVWVAPDGSFRSEERREASFGARGELHEPPDAGQAPLETAGDDLPAGTFDPKAALGLPRDPEHLKGALLSSVATLDCASSEAEAKCLGTAIADLYSRYVIPSDLAAGFWQVLAGQPAIALLGEVTDRNGRAGVAIAYASGPAGGAQHATVLVIDESSGQLTGTEDVVRDSTAAGGVTVASVRIWMRAAFVDELGDLP